MEGWDDDPAFSWSVYKKGALLGDSFLDRLRLISFKSIAFWLIYVKIVMTLIERDEYA